MLRFLIISTVYRFSRRSLFIQQQQSVAFSSFNISCQALGNPCLFPSFMTEDRRPAMTPVLSTHVCLWHPSAFHDGLVQSLTSSCCWSCFYCLAVNASMWDWCSVQPMTTCWKWRSVLRWCLPATLTKKCAVMMGGKIVRLTHLRKLLDSPINEWLSLKFSLFFSSAVTDIWARCWTQYAVCCPVYYTRSTHGVSCV